MGIDHLYENCDRELVIKTYKLGQANMTDRWTVILDCVNAAAVKEI